MDIRQFLINWLRRLALIHGFTMMAMYLIARFFNPGVLPDVPFLGKMILFSLAGTVPGLIYYSRHEYSDREWWIRTVLHFILLNVLLLPISHAIGLWSGFAGLAIMVASILVIDIAVHFVSFRLNCRMAEDINRIIKGRKAQ